MMTMGTYLRRHYAKQGLLPARGCPGDSDYFVWSDNADQRTRASGDALVAGLYLGCSASARHAPVGTDDSLFGSIKHGLCAIDPESAKAAILARAGGSLDALGPSYERARNALQQVLFPAASQTECMGNVEAKCFLFSGRNTLRTNGDAVRLEGPLGIASTITESILLESAEGLSPDKVGWGRVTEEKLAAIMPLHDLYADLTRKTPYIASRNGALLARQIVDVIEGSENLSFSDAAPVPRSARFIAFVGHDTNLSNIASLLDVDWELPDQPDKTAPDTALAFEVWRNSEGSRYVRLVIHSQTLAQLRGTKASPGTEKRAQSTSVTIPGCTDRPDGLCTLNIVANRLAKAIEPSCLQ
jgi:4-phytase/acid phosphatase